MERPIRFPNRNGENLFGMCFIPDVPTDGERIGVILSVNAVKSRTGTYGLHTTLARMLCAQGYYAMCFDPAGIGDSEGTFEEKYLREHYLDIQRGKYRNDFADAVGYFQAECDVTTILLFGLCGGAISTLIAAAADPRVSGLILLAVPVLLESEENLAHDDDEAATITSEGHAGSVLVDFVRKLGRRDTWRKLARMEIHWTTNLKVAAKAAAVLASKTSGKLIRSAVGRVRRTETIPISPNPRFNRLFQESFLRFTNGRHPVLIVLAEHDFITWQFKSEFEDLVLRPGNPWTPWYEIHVVERANHIFGSRENQVRLQQIIREWLRERFPVRIAAHRHQAQLGSGTHDRL